MSNVCPPCGLSPLEDYVWWVSQNHGEKNKKKRQCIWWCAACGDQYNWRDANCVFAAQASPGPNDAMVFRAHAPPQGACENSIGAAKACWLQCTAGTTG